MVHLSGDRRTPLRRMCVDQTLRIDDRRPSTPAIPKREGLAGRISNLARQQQRNIGRSLERLAQRDAHLSIGDRAEGGTIAN
jgi:hypothetical protein